MHNITTSTLDLHTISEIISGNKKLTLSDEAKNNISACRDYLDKKMASQKGPIYGINTGFGSLCNVVIPDADLEIHDGLLVRRWTTRRKM